MIRGVGIDLVRIERMKRILSSSRGESFQKRCFTPAERSFAVTRGKAAAATLAARWAAKEAAAKALGCGIGVNCALLDLEVTMAENGAPRLLLSGAAARYVAAHGGGSFHISLTHEEEYASAVVIWEI